MTIWQTFDKFLSPIFFVCGSFNAMCTEGSQCAILLVINCFGVWYNLYLAIRGLYHPRLRLGWYSPLIARYKLYHTPKQLITNSIARIYINLFIYINRITNLSHDCLLDLCIGNKNEHTYIHTNTGRLIQDSERLIQLHIICQLTNQKPRILPIMR